MLFKEIVDGRTHGRMHRRWTPDIEGSQKLTEHFVLRWAKNVGKMALPTWKLKCISVYPYRSDFTWNDNTNDV